MEENLHGTKKLMYSIAKNYSGKNSEEAYAIKDKYRNLLTQPEDIRLWWKKYFDELLNVENDPEPELGAEARLEEERAIDQEPSQITYVEMKDAIAAMKKGKSP